MVSSYHIGQYRRRSTVWKVCFSIFNSCLKSKSNFQEKCNVSFLIILIAFIHDAPFIGIMVILRNDIFQIVHSVLVRTRRNFVFGFFSFCLCDGVTFLLSLFCAFVYILYPPFLCSLLLVMYGFKTHWERTHGHFKQLRTFMQF